MNQPVGGFGDIWAVGRNYDAHARELGNAPAEEPFFFLKSRSSLWLGPEPPRLPRGRGPVHHEVEMVVQIGAGLAPAAVAVGLDLTLREVQGRFKERRLPWALSKSFQDSAIVSELVPLTEGGPDLADLELVLRVNGEVRQQGLTSQMRHSVAALIEYLGARVGLRDGDLLFTGTPSGVGPVEPGDRLELDLSGVASLAVRFR